MSIAAFYSSARWGTRFGVVDADHPNGHRGFDVESNAGEAIPALRAGLVVRSQFSSILGWVIVVQAGQGDFDGYCHTKNGVPVGTAVSAAQSLAFVADFGDQHGSAWTGPHTHVTRGPTADSVFSGTVWDPLPLIKSVLASTAGGGTIPFDNTPPPPKDSSMKLIIRSTKPSNDKEGIYYLAEIGGGLKLYTGTQAQANGLSVKLGPTLTVSDLGCATWAEVEALCAPAPSGTPTDAQMAAQTAAIIKALGEPLTAKDIPAIADAAAVEFGDRLDGTNDGK